MMRVRLRTAEAMIFVAAARALVRFVPFARWRPMLGASRPYSPPAEPAATVESGLAEKVRYCSAAVRRASYRLPASLCLPQAMAMRWMLARRGIKCAVIVGFLPSNQRGSAHDLHAWVEWNGKIVLGDSGGAHSILLQFS